MRICTVVSTLKKALKCQLRRKKPRNGNRAKKKINYTQKKRIFASNKSFTEIKRVWHAYNRIANETQNKQRCWQNIRHTKKSQTRKNEEIEFEQK